MTPTPKIDDRPVRCNIARAGSAVGMGPGVTFLLASAGGLAARMAAPATN